MGKHTKIRLYVDMPLQQEVVVELPKDQAHYLHTVMRVAVGSIVLLFNGRDGGWQSKIVEISKKTVLLLPMLCIESQSAPPDVWLVFAPIKKGRLDYMVEKATEMGVAKIVPMATEFTNFSKVKIEKMQANAVEAAEQCERLDVPEVTEIQSLKTLLKTWPEGRHIMFCDESFSDITALEALLSVDKKATKKPWAIFIGPEGGFSETERTLIKARPETTVVSLGPRILRADTAAVVAMSLWQTALGDW